MPIQAPLLLPPRTTHPSTQSSRGVTANAISPRESQIWVYFFARKRNEFLQRRFSDFEKKRRKFSKKNAFPLVSTYIHTHLDLPPLSLYLSRACHFYGCFLLTHSHRTILLFYDHITLSISDSVKFKIHSRKPTSIIYFNLIRPFLLSHSRCGSPSSFIAWLFPLLPPDKFHFEPQNTTTSKDS